MGTLTISLCPQPAQTAFNMRRWEEVLADPGLGKIEGRIETDRHGQIILSPPPSARHSSFQFQIGYLLRTLMPHGRVLSECPISTADGVKAADVAWASAESIQESGNHACFSRAPEICVEVLSPGNTDAEMEEKVALYFDAGAQEVWLCGTTGTMTFLASAKSAPLEISRLCPEFPKFVELR